MRVPTLEDMSLMAGFPEGFVGTSLYISTLLLYWSLVHLSGERAVAKNPYITVVIVKINVSLLRQR